MKEFSTREFADALGISRRTLEDWRLPRKGNRLLPARYDGNRAVYTEAQLETARELLKNGKAKKATASPKDKCPQPCDSHTEPNVDDVHADADAAIEEIHDNNESPATIDVDAKIITLADRAEKIRQLQADVQRGIIEIGFELIAAKAEIGFGGWSKWLEKEFNWTDRTARYFMAVAERFGNRNTYSDLKPSTLKAMLLLPVGDEQDFIDEQSASGKPVEKQSAREVQRNVKAWNDRRKQSDETHADTSESKIVGIVAIDDDSEPTTDTHDEITPAAQSDDGDKTSHLDTFFAEREAAISFLETSLNFIEIVGGFIDEQKVQSFVQLLVEYWHELEKFCYNEQKLITKAKCIMQSVEEITRASNELAEMIKIEIGKLKSSTQDLKSILNEADEKKLARVTDADRKENTNE